MIATVLQIAGAILVTAAAFVVSLPLGLLVGGAWAVVFGVVLERGS